MPNPTQYQEQLALPYIPHIVEGEIIQQRAVDGYINATAMCKAARKQFADFARLKNTNEFLAELSGSTGIPIDQLVYSNMVGPNAERGTWVHPDVAINLGQWLSPKFAVQVSSWVREWMSGGRSHGSVIPYHLRRYLANRSQIPHTHFSVLNELTFALIAPMENVGYTLPEKMMPDISEGRMFCKWLRDVKGIDTNALPTYPHTFENGRIVQAKLYPNSVLADFRAHFHEIWLPQKAVQYLKSGMCKHYPI